MSSLINYGVHFNYFAILQSCNQLHHFNEIRLRNSNDYDHTVHNSNSLDIIYISGIIT